MATVSRMNRRVLLVAYYFPPFGLSGVQRVSKFVKYLPEFGWDVSVLTIKPGSYFAYDTSLLQDVERPGVVIHRTVSLDPTRMFPKREVGMPGETGRRLFTRISQILFQPDNKIGWYPFALRKGKRILADSVHDAILSSAPPYTDHVVAAALSKSSGLPLVLDYRDDWIDNPRHLYPSAWHKNRARAQEKRVLSIAKSVVTINSVIQKSIRSRAASSLTEPAHYVIPHGYDPDDFSADRLTEGPLVSEPSRMNLFYGGVFYDAQQPDTFLRGLRLFLDQVPAARDRVVASFVGFLPDSATELISSLGLTDVVDYRGYMSHEESVQELQKADILWMTVGKRPGSEGVSTGKLYEYIGSRKPILGLVPEGEARETLIEYGASSVVAPDDVENVAAAIGELFSKWESETLPSPLDAFVTLFNRKRLAAELANILNDSLVSQ
ncbi:MAG: glycosyltransferase family 4 protein [Rhodothermia bacterium]|nr:MAG: glycosyltransferase family 4 protein [Rhodothermia bacterium]